jgi:hypothetical protein
LALFFVGWSVENEDERKIDGEIAATTASSILRILQRAAHCIFNFFVRVSFYTFLVKTRTIFFVFIHTGTAV